METNSLQYMRSTSFTHKSTLRDASFSSYLIPPQPSPIHDSELSIFDAQKYFNEPPNNISSNLDPKEIRTSVVPTTTIEERARLSSVSSVTDGYSRNYRIHSFHATPTASSEASWNSQTGLLSNPPGSIMVSLKNIIPTDNRDCDDHRGRRKGKSAGGTKWLFRPKCPCSGRKSVQVCEKKLREPYSNNNNHRNAELVASSKRNSVTILEERKEKVLSNTKSHLTSVSSYVPSNTVHKSSNQQSMLETVNYGTPAGVQPRGGTGGGGRGEGFSFPILKKMGLPKIPIDEDPPRDSLEVFQPSSDEPISNKSNIVRDGRTAGAATAYGFSFVGSPISRVTGTEDDVASDASSDLFEIESFSTQTTTSYPMYLRRESVDEANTFSNMRRLAVAASNGGGGNFINSRRQSIDEPTTPTLVAPTECYAPSEASIDWSVTTAEGFDRASITNFSSVSACEWDNGGGGGNRHHGGGGWGIMEGGRMMRKGNCGLLSCRHEKSVNVGPSPVKYVLEEQPYGAFPLISSTTRHVSGRVTNPKIPFVSTSHSARLSLPFAAAPI